MKPEFITFTGADDQTSVADMLTLSIQYPVEFGVLFSQGRAGDARYPGLTQIASFAHAAEASGGALKLAAHLCGGFSRRILDRSQDSRFFQMQVFRRAQINFSQDDRQEPKAELSMRAREWAVAEFGAKPVIFQSRFLDGFSRDLNTAWLYDRSGGRGELPGRWPVPYKGSPMVGYAGGLGPNTQEAFEKIEAAAGATPYWLDMESGVRDEQDRFSLVKCRQVCEAIYG